MFKRIAFILLAMLLLLSACGKKSEPAASEQSSAQEESTPAESSEEESQEEASEEPAAEESAEEAPAEEESSEEAAELSAPKSANSLTVTPVTAFDASSKSLNSLNGDGFYYRDDNGLYGIMNYDASSDTGAIYATVKSEGNYFMVTKDPSDTSEDPATLNRYGIVDATGRVIIPEEYAGFKSMEGRYITAIQVTEVTDDQDEALMYYTSSMFSIQPDEDDVLFKGVWTVFDAVTGKQIEGATGTVAYWPSCNGDFLKYTTDDGTEHIVGPAGQTLPDGAELQTNGTYVLSDDTTGAVYDIDGNELFSFDPAEYNVRYSTSNGYYAEKSDEDYNYYQAILDDKGQLQSEFVYSLQERFGPYIVAKDGDQRFLFNLDGTKAFEQPLDYSGYWDTNYDRYGVYGTEDEGFICVDKEGNLLLEAGSDVEVSYTDLAPYITDENSDYKYYSFADQDYKFTGYSYSISLVAQRDEEGNSDLIDIFTGDILFSGNRSYNIDVASDGTVWVIVETPDLSWEFYTLSK